MNWDKHFYKIKGAYSTKRFCKYCHFQNEFYLGKNNRRNGNQDRSEMINHLKQNHTENLK